MGIRASRPTWTATILPSLTHRRTVSGWRPKRFATSPERSIRVFSVRITRIYYSNYSNLSTVVDPIVTHLAALSTGDFLDNPRHYRKAEKKLKKLQAALSRKKRGSHRRNKAVQA